MKTSYKGGMVRSPHGTGGDRHYAFFPGNPEIGEDHPLLSRADSFAVTLTQAKRHIKQEVEARERERGD